MGNEYLGVNKIVDYCYRFGFGEITGIDLPGEVSGLVPNPEWKQEYRGVPWVGGDTINLSIGQGDINTTPLQLADMMALIINGGNVYQPYILKEVRDATTFQVVEKVTPKILRTTSLRPETVKEMKSALRSVVTNGTPKDVMTTKAIQIAAKTGTSETGNVEDKHSWFVAYAPYDYSDINDVVVAVVWIDAMNAWDWWAPKAANILLHGIFTKQDYEHTVEDLQPLWYLSEPEPLEDQ
jgi:penicillin-binding protein 2